MKFLWSSISNKIKDLEPQQSKLSELSCCNLPLAATLERGGPRRPRMSSMARRNGPSLRTRSTRFKSARMRGGTPTRARMRGGTPTRGNATTARKTGLGGGVWVVVQRSQDCYRSKSVGIRLGLSAATLDPLHQSPMLLHVYT